MRLFITGGTGFVGRRLLGFARDDGIAVTALVRDPAAIPVTGAGGPDVVVGDLLDPDPWRGRLGENDVVVHLAALTGKARRAEYVRTNLEGTRVLLDAALAAGVGRFVFVSSIAAGFSDKTRYPYATTKLAAERLVLDADLDGIVARPTIIVGPDAPVLAGLEKMAGMPVTPIFGDGRVSVQPVHVDDVARAVLDLARGAAGDEKEVDVGGPDVVTIEELLGMVRRLRSGRPPRVLHLPLAPIRAVLGMLEAPFLSVLPLTAGQLATFANDGTARPSAFMDKRSASLISLDRALEESLHGDH